MPVASPESVIKDIEAGKYTPVYFLQGEEAFYIDAISDFIEANALDETAKGFNQIILYGKDVTISDVLNNARRFPMMSERQVVIVKEAAEISDLNQADSQKMLLDYFKNPQLSTVLVFAHKHKSLDGRKSFGKEVAALTLTVTTKKIYDNQLPQWVGQYLNAQGLKADPEATELIAAYIGNDLQRVANEIRKMKMNLDGNARITADTVKENIGISKEFNIFELQKALFEGNRLKANQIINYFASNPKKHPLIPLIGFLYSVFSKLLILHHMQDKSDQAILGIVKNKFALYEFKKGMRNFPLPLVLVAIHDLKQADLASKGILNPSVDSEAILKELIFKLLY